MAKSSENCVPNKSMCFIFLVAFVLQKSTFRDIDTVGGPKRLVYGYNVSSSIFGGIAWTFFSCYVSGSNWN